MTLYEKIITLYPELKNEAFFSNGITLRNDSDGKGDYIYIWEHATLPRPTKEQLDALDNK